MKVIMPGTINDFLDSLEKSSIAKVNRLVTLLKEYGPVVPMPHGKKIAKNLWELRIRGVQEVRIFYTVQKDTAIIFHAFIKKSQQIPRKEMRSILRKLQLYTH